MVSPYSFPASCGGSPQGAMIGSTFYFLNHNNSNATITSYDTATRAWGSISAAPAADMLKGESMAAVSDPTGFGNDFLIVSGGGTNRVVAYSLKNRTWSEQKGLLHIISNSCSVGCDGLFYTMTGDFKKDTNGVGTGKPTDRQIYAYNLTSGVVFTNNGEKTRGGAGCACGDKAGVIYFAGGYSDGGISDQVEVWRTPLARRGEPKLSMGESKRDVGGVGCGGMAIFAGGDNGDHISSGVEIWNTSMNISDPTQLVPKTYILGEPLRMPRVGCIGGRFALISGGYGASGCNSKVYVLDTTSLPPHNSVLPSIGSLNATDSVAIASSLHGTTLGLFNGETLDVFQLEV